MSVVFDFDYTLGDSTNEIVLSINYALSKLGYGEKETETIRKTIELSLKDTFKVLTGTTKKEDLFYNSVEDSLLKFAVIISKSIGKWVFCKHKERDTYEVPGGHREDGESILETAKRELQENYFLRQYNEKWQRKQESQLRQKMLRRAIMNYYEGKETPVYLGNENVGDPEITD